MYKPEYWRKSWEKLRRKVHEALGGKCVRCGFSDERALQIDHVYGGGVRQLYQRSGSRMSYLRWVLASVLAGENRYQLLCANCNWIKRSENGETRRCR